MRYPNIFGQVKAAPDAEAAPPAPLDDSNSFIDPTQPDRRIPNALNTRHFAVAESAEKPAAAEAAAADDEE